MDEFTKLQATLADIDKGVKDLHAAGKAMQSWREAAEPRIKATEEKLAAALGTRIPGLGDDKDSKNFSILRAAYAQSRNDWRDAKVEKDIIDQTVKLHNERMATLPEQARVMTTATDTSAGFLVPVQVMAELIEFQLAQSVLARAGAQYWTGLVGSPVQMPKETSDWASPAEVAENGAIGYDDMATGQVSWSPRKLGRGIKLSRESALLANPSIEAWARMRIAQKLALVKDLRGLRGSGASMQPLGIANQASINTVALGTDGGQVSYDVFVDMEYELAADNEMLQGGRYAYIMHPRTHYKARKLKDSQGRPLFDHEATGENPAERFIGHPCFHTTQLPLTLTKGASTDCSEIYFGNFQLAVFAQWGQMRVEASIEAGDSTNSAFTNDQLWVKAVELFDFNILRPTGFCLVNDVR